MLEYLVNGSSLNANAVSFLKTAHMYWQLQLLSDYKMYTSHNIPVLCIIATLISVYDKKMLVTYIIETSFNVLH